MHSTDPIRCGGTGVQHRWWATDANCPIRPAAGLTFCAARNACLAPSSPNSLLEGENCCSDGSWPTPNECKAGMTCSSKQCACPTAGQHYCSALSACRLPLAAGSGAENAACCPDASWPEANECRGGMECDAASSTCQCPQAGQAYCAASAACAVQSPPVKLGLGSTCCWASQCSSGFCVGSKCAPCAAGEQAAGNGSQTARLADGPLLRPAALWMLALAVQPGRLIATYGAEPPF